GRHLPRDDQAGRRGGGGGPRAGGAEGARGVARGCRLPQVHVRHPGQADRADAHLARVAPGRRPPRPRLDGARRRAAQDV
ncbi:MAG: hypothetical protein AVDCRST_MAG89-4757, partial [uncultured Gemmatimonadetes bacterium]